LFVAADIQYKIIRTRSNL